MDANIKDKDHETALKCPLCDKEMSRLGLGSHVAKQHKNACNICYQEFESKEKIESHISKDHSIKDFNITNRCVVCDITFKSKFRDHLVSKHNVSYKCKICLKKLSSLIKLREHKEQHKLDKSDNLCPNCGKKFYSKEYLQEHISKYCGTLWKENKCLKCKESFESRAATIEHIADKHQDIKLFDCSECKQRYLTETSLKTHISFVHCYKIGVICPICGKNLRNKTILRDHISYVHEGKEKPKYKCSHCDYSSTLKKFLESHISSVHEGLRYQCPTCNEEFKTNLKLNGHFATLHDRSKLFQCLQCERAYLSEKKLTEHIGFSHEKTIMNLCSLCGVNCSTKSGLSSHMKRHKLAGIHIYHI